ncbi:hypothetical protein KZ813_15910 [Sphingomonas sp. RHCKR7]|uniref:hypothetical protein n=1 Tax=Sphingomonas folli TaxID=2862497 RepID=UPI001CA570F9|nr:hypothetical protein [Sphingomonas folli]MBW6528327.1 hypothetical protein [Sphingomonas folli]
MARFFSFSSGISLELSDYLSWVNDNVDEQDLDSLAASAEMLYRLTLNNSLLNDHILGPLKASLDQVQPKNQYTDATFLLGTAKMGGLLVRANLWKPLKAINGSTAYEADIYSYDVPHDHNFDFLTAGYYGLGYRTDIFSYETRDLSLVEGESVEITHVKTMNLTPDDLILFEKSRDIYTQIPPKSPSISINLLCVTNAQALTQQCFFDIDKKKLSGYANGPTSTRVQMIKMVEVIGIKDAVDLLIPIICRHPCVRTRAAAIECVLRMCPDLRSHLHSLVGHERAPLLVRALATN